jgi:DNA-binding response OmpR family regulator
VAYAGLQECPPLESPIVVIVDDEPLIAAIVELEFGEAGFDVHSVRDAAGAADAIAGLGTRLSALVTDIKLGKGPDGWAVATEARQRLPRLPVVYMTGDSGADWPAFGVPRSVLIQKPFVGAQVFAAVIALMNADKSDPVFTA